MAHVVLGWLWYAKWSPTGKIWAREANQSGDNRPTPVQLISRVLVTALGAFLLMFILNHDAWAYRDAFSNVAAGGRAGYDVSHKDALRGGVARWIGYFVPPFLAAMVWARKSFAVTAVHAGYYLVSLLIASMIIAQFL